MYGGGGGRGVYVCVYRFCIMFHIFFFFFTDVFSFLYFSNIENRRQLPRVSTSSGVPSLFKSEHLTVLESVK